MRCSGVLAPEIMAISLCSGTDVTLSLMDVVSGFLLEWRSVYNESFTTKFGKAKG